MSEDILSNVNSSRCEPTPEEMKQFGKDTEITNLAAGAVELAFEMGAELADKGVVASMGDAISGIHDSMTGMIDNIKERDQNCARKR